ncbi:hypothetical protein [Pseudonocardia sp.]|uniref:hypothetical protein n=1 Tax=Pseudonocardia sp. TaxID=60912 RepID=UPI003D0EC94C
MAGFGLLAAGVTWRWSGLRTAGNTLVDAADGGDETGRVLACILLVKAGDRSVPLVTEALLAGRGGPDLVDVLASIGSPRARAALDEVARDASAECRAAAQDALRTLDRIENGDG